jgi:hypothetical protein
MREIREIDDELAARRARRDVPASGFEAALALAADPAERDALHERWLALERDLEPAHEARRAMREDLAQRAGAQSVADLLGAAHPRAPLELVAPFERIVVEPLDEAVGRASRRLWRAYGRGSSPPAAADAPRVEQRIANGGEIGRDAIVGAMRRLAARSEFPGAVGVDHGSATAAGPGAVWRLARDGRAWVGIGACPGEPTLRAALGARGAATRAAFVASARGSVAARFADPAYAAAAETLYGRLALSATFRDWAGLRPLRESSALGLHESVATRLGWVYLQTVLAHDEATSPAFGRSVERASGGPVTPAHRDRVRDVDPAAAASLRGAILGLLLEERLLTRFGRAWFDSTRARGWLSTMWEAEPDHAAEELAAAAELGSFEPTPVLDASRAGLAAG